MDKEMELLLSEKELIIGDKTVVVKRLALLDTIRIAAKISDVISIMLNSKAGLDNALVKVLYNGRPQKDASGKVIEYDTPETEADIGNTRFMGIVELIGLFGDDFIDLLRNLIVKSTNLTNEEVEQLDSVDGIDLVIQIYEVNKGFFKKCMIKPKGEVKKKEETKN